jgi:hypothetical protein
MLRHYPQIELIHLIQAFFKFVVPRARYALPCKISVKALKPFIYL